MMADGDTPITASPAVPAVAAQEPAPAATPPAATPAPVDLSPVVEAVEAAPASGDPPAPAAGATSEIPAPEPTLLEKFDAEKKVSEAKPGEEKKPAAEAAPKPDAEKPVETAPPIAELPPVEYKYELPETLKMDDTLRGEVHGALDKFRADPANPQPLIDLHAKTMADYAQHVSREQHRVWGETQQNWQRDVMSDPQLGGSGHQTAMGVVARMRDKFVAEADRPAFEEFLRVTGAGNHPQFLKLLHNAGRAFDEPPLPPPDAKPTATNGANPNRRATLYDNPRSHTARQ